MESFLTFLDQCDRDLHLNQIKPVNKVYDFLGRKYKRIYIVLTAIAVSTITVISVFGLSFVSNVFAFIPAYASFKALQSPNPGDDKLWLTYWVMFGSMGMIETLLSTVLWVMPGYYLLKIVFAVWAYNPRSKGAIVMYQQILSPLYDHLESFISNTLSSSEISAAAKSR